ncbi:MMPL family transporter [Streptomyces viridosporus]|uniref:MMPL family transporter n=1 Tax=Streptomyces viridosporus TaxID=67581 RepID=UPI0036F9319D
MVRIARWSATHPWSAIGLWGVFVALCLFLGGAVGTNKISDEESGVGESGRAGRITAAGDFPEKPEENVLITAADGRTFDAGVAREAAQDLSQRMKSLPEVESVATAVPSPDGKALLVTVTMKGDTENADQRVQPLLDVSEATEKAHEGLRIDEVGTGSTAKGLGETLGEDFVKAELISLPLTLLILLVVFGAVIAAGVPVVLALSCVAAAIGLSTLASHVLPETSAVSNIILLMGMAVGVDYSLFSLEREREERQKGVAHIDAIEIAAKTSGHTVVMSGTTVIVSMAGLYLADEATFASLATGSIIVVAVAVLASLTVLPALLAKLGRWVDRPRVPFLWRLTMRSGDSKLWPVLLRPALVRPVLTLVVSVGALLLLALPALDMKLKQPGSDDLSRDIPVVQAMDRLTEAFPSKGTVHQVAVRAPADRAADVEAALGGLLKRTAGDDLFAHDQTPTIRTSADNRVHTVQVGTPHSPKSDGARDSLELLRDWVPQAMEGVPGAESAVGGKVAQGASTSPATWGTGCRGWWASSCC